MKKLPLIHTPLPGPKARKLINQDRTYVSPSYTRYYPLVVEKAKGPARTWRNDIIKHAFQKGLLLLGCGENSIRFCPSLTVNTEEIDKCLSIFDDVVSALP